MENGNVVVIRAEHVLAASLTIKDETGVIEIIYGQKVCSITSDREKAIKSFNDIIATLETL